MDAVWKEVSALYHRLFCHQGVTQPELQFMYSEFEEKRGGEFNRLLQASHLLNEANDTCTEATLVQIDSTKNATQRILTKLDAITNTLNKIVERGSQSYRTYIDSETVKYNSEFCKFEADLKTKMENVDKEYQEKISETADYYRQMEDKYELRS